MHEQLIHTVYVYLILRWICRNQIKLSVYMQEHFYYYTEEASLGLYKWSFLFIMYQKPYTLMWSKHLGSMKLMRCSICNIWPAYMHVHVKIVGI